MRATKFIAQTDARFSLRSLAPVIWPWILVTMAWTVALLAVLTKQTSLINHSYLLTQSHLLWIVALVVFLAYWQVMIFAMMVPSSMPLVCIVVYASRRQQHPWMMQGAFLAGYALVWTAFACGAFLADTVVHWLVNNWFWLYVHSWLISATTFALAGGFQCSSLKKHCLMQNRSPLSFFTRYYRCFPEPRPASRNVVPGWLLGFDAGDVWYWNGKHDLDGRIDWSDGH